VTTGVAAVVQAPTILHYAKNKATSSNHTKTTKRSVRSASTSSKTAGKASDLTEGAGAQPTLSLTQKPPDRAPRQHCTACEHSNTNQLGVSTHSHTL
jgi:hypothetical protein